MQIGEVKQCKPIPQWDMSIVLDGLCAPPFEPLERVENKYLSFKITFLLAITSKRVVKLQARSSADLYPIVLPDRILLKYLPTFLPKVPTFKNINQVITCFLPRTLLRGGNQVTKVTLL